MFLYSSFPVSLSTLHSSPFTLEYIIVDLNSLPDFSPLLSFSWSFPCGHISHYTYPECLWQPHVQRWLCCTVCMNPQSSSSAYCPHSFSLHQSGHPMLPQSCSSHEVSDWAWKPLLRLLRFASFVADLQLPWCFRQVSHSAFIVAVLHAEGVQPGCYLNQLSVSKITFSVRAVGLALCTTAPNALLLFPEQLPFPLEYWQAAFLRQNIKSPAALSKCLSSSGTGSRT